MELSAEFRINLIYLGCNPIPISDYLCEMTIIILCHIDILFLK
nr:MAG TPA: hypothetical protein [Caudoviricetes sp.]